jgi:hypothetical protein
LLRCSTFFAFLKTTKAFENFDNKTLPFKMKTFKNISILIFLFSFFSTSWTNFDNENAVDVCIVQLESDVLINFWDSIQVHAVTNYPLDEIEEIIWSPVENVSCTDCLDPFVSASEDICISVTITFDDGCIASDEICVFVQGCGEGEVFLENKINSITPESISNEANIELEIAQTQFVHFEIVENDEILYTIKEGWVGKGRRTLTLDFSEVPAGNHTLRVRLYPEDKFISITKL